METDSPAPHFGLLVPCKNGARFLPRLFAAIRAQKRPFDQVWLFDDGSTDDSSEVARRLGAQVLRSEKSVGPSAARNRLIAACACEWLHFHDADDSLDPAYLLKTAREVRKNVDIVVCDMIWTDDVEDGSGKSWVYQYDREAFERHRVAYLVGNTVGGINGLYRRTLLQAVNGFDEALFYWEDMDLNMRLCSHGAGVAIVNEALVTAFRHPASHCNSNPGEVWRVKLRLLTQLLTGADGVLRNAVAVDAEGIARRLAGMGLWSEVSDALKVARSGGAHPPTTNSLVLRAAKALLPATTAFRLQHWLHHLLQHHGAGDFRGIRN